MIGTVLARRKDIKYKMQAISQSEAENVLRSGGGERMERSRSKDK
jgi:hypothetical protein